MDRPERPDDIRIAFAGNAHVHVPDYVQACRSRTDARIVGACLIDDESPYRFPGDVPVVGAPNELPPHDLCVVTTDIRSHGRVATAMTAPHVYVEKPLGTSAAAARRVASSLRRDGRTVHTGFFLRREPAFGTLRARLAARRLGRPRRIDMVYEHDGLQSGWLTDWPAHLDRRRMGYGTFGDLAGHLIELCHRTVGPLRPVRCVLRRPPGARSDTGGRALLRTIGGVEVRLSAGGDAPATRLEVRIETERGALLLRDGVLTEALHGRVRTLARCVEPTPRSGFLATLDQMRGRDVRRGAGPGEAIAVNEALDRIHVVASTASAFPLGGPR